MPNLTQFIPQVLLLVIAAPTASPIAFGADVTHVIGLAGTTREESTAASSVTWYNIDDFRTGAHRGTLPFPSTGCCLQKDLPPLQASGHDTTMPNLTQFIPQVCYLKYAKCYRSNNILLLEVSCPIDLKRLLTLCCSAVTFVFNCLLSLPHDGCLLFLDALLLLCGDVELNPGPTDMEKLSKLIENLASTNDKYQNETRERLSGISSGIDELKQKVATLEKQMQEINGIKERLAVVESSLHEVQREVCHSHDKIDALDAGIDDLNNRMRWNNLLFRGIPEKQKETWEETACLIKEFVNNHLGVYLGGLYC
ncbi:uncharacterized protein LOC121047448 [Ixodes scapularis]|uniref:uncharacterized protein LOC121047448 n=1 Tax=Ixodes scapularis TaxID=6945 RepID=UPI001C38CABD|nr:uncharacterized protein LOC121047448 [Ixodes scapularis]